MTAAATLLEVEGLCKSYGGGRRLLQPPAPLLRALVDVSFVVARGEVLGVVGESGSGKSTLAKLIVRLIEPSSGRVLLRGHDLAGLASHELRRQRRHLQMVFQDPYSSLNPYQRVGATQGEVLEIHGLGPAGSRDRRVGELLELVGLPRHYADRFPHEFSGGQRQRIGIARAIAAEPDLIVADEPLAALDVSIQAQVLNLLRELQQRLGLAMVFIAHNLAVVRHIADRVFVLYLGRVVETGPVEALFERPAHPYTRALLSAIPDSDPDAPRRRVTLAGEIPSPFAPPSGCVFRTRCPHAIAACAAELPALRDLGAGRRAACIRDDIIA